MKKLFFLPVLALLNLFVTCKKEFDTPPVKQANDGNRITISMIKTKYKPNAVYKFVADSNLYCIVTADEISGNLYKDIYVRDATGALHVKLINSGGLFIGDSIRINLKDVILNNYSELIQLDSVDLSKSIVKLASGLKPEPELMTIAQIIASTAATNKIQSRLVKINNVQFATEGQNQPYANAISKAAVQYTLQDCNNNKIAIRTSGYCFFANQNTPGGNGSIIAIASQYNNLMQLIIRSPDEVVMNGSLCTIINPTTTTAQSFLIKNFEDGSVSNGGWTNVNVTGTVNWAVKTSTNSSDPTKVAECNNYLGSGNQPACETWLMSPPINLTASSAPTFSFTSASIFTGAQLQTLISINYLSGLPATATWITLTPAYGTSATHLSSGIISLASYKNTAVTLAFKYTGNLSSGQRWQVDNIRVWE